MHEKGARKGMIQGTAKYLALPPRLQREHHQLVPGEGGEEGGDKAEVCWLTDLNWEMVFGFGGCLE